MTKKERGADLTRMVIAPNPNRFSMARQMAHVAPSVGVFDEPTRCYRVNHEWAAHIAGCVSILIEPEMWVGADDERHIAIQSILKFLEGTVCDVIDCADIEDCLDTSETIEALSLVTFSTAYNNTQAHFDYLDALYDGTAQSIGANIPTTAPDLDSFHDNALCWVLESIIDLYAATKGISLTLAGGLTGWWIEAVNAMRGIVPILPNWLFHLLGDELYGCVADIAAALVVLADNAAILEFACCLREELRGVGMSEANYNAAIATCVASLSGNAGDLACLFDGDNSLDHYLSFLEAYSGILQWQTDGKDFRCQCTPDGWEWVDLDFEWITPVHSGNRTSPLITHTNPANRELFSMTYRFQSVPPGDNKATPIPTGLPDQWLTSTPLFRGSNLWMCENEFAGVAEGRDAVGWPGADFFDINTNNAVEQPGMTWTLQFKDGVSLGHTASGKISNVRLLYKIVP